MIEVKFIFPIKSDADTANDLICNFFAASKMFVENRIIVGPVKKDKEKPSGRPYWYFLFDICEDSNDTNIEKFCEISGGILGGLNNKERNIWVFS